MRNLLVVQVKTEGGTYRLFLEGDVKVEPITTDSPPFEMQKNNHIHVDWMACALESVNFTVGAPVNLDANSTVLMVDAGADRPLRPITLDLQGFGALQPEWDHREVKP